MIEYFLNTENLIIKEYLMGQKQTYDIGLKENRGLNGLQDQKEQYKQDTIFIQKQRVGKFIQKHHV
jgi:hypothetical protein